jgi:hypothetical protein
VRGLLERERPVRLHERGALRLREGRGGLGILHIARGREARSLQRGAGVPDLLLRLPLARGRGLELLAERGGVERDERVSGRDERPLRREPEDLQLHSRHLGRIGVRAFGSEDAHDRNRRAQRPALHDGFAGRGRAGEGADGGERDERRERACRGERARAARVKASELEEPFPLHGSLAKSSSSSVPAA